MAANGITGGQGEDDRWLARVSPATRAFVAAHTRRRTFRDGARVYAVGDAPDGLYRIVSGEVRLLSYAATGRQIVALVARRRHWFGELSVLDGGPRPHDAVCHGAVELLHVPMRDIAAFSRSHPAILGEVALIACEHQRAALTFIGTILSKPGRARLCEMILATAARAPGAAQASLSISQEDLAGRIGVSRQHLGRMIAELKQAGAIATRYGRIDVLDPRRLVALAN